MELTPYLRVMVERNASDMFFSVGARPHVKIEGRTVAVGHTTLDSESALALARETLDDEQFATFEADFELNCAISVPDVGRFRLNVFRQRGEVALVVRYIRDRVPALADLGLPDVLEELVLAKRGLVLVVGASGSGKSTTIASMIDFRNRNATGHILTIEDPIEFVHPHVRSVVDQREVGIDTHSYGDALRNALREAPDVILIGEVRDEATMHHALHFAETGHLCLATLHATNANQAVERIVNFFPEPARDRVQQDLSLHLSAVVSQRLIPGLDGRRVAAVEVMRNGPFIAELIEKGRIFEIKDVMQRQTGEGVQTFDQAVYELWKAGRIGAKEAVRYADSAHNVRIRIEFEAPGTFSTSTPEDLSIESE